MDFFGGYRSPFGYENGKDGGVDSYGVDHSGFSTQDELQYQTLRTNREEKLAEDLRRRGVAEENYPQCGASFWGNRANNYGFGNSNISQNIQNVTNQLNNSEFSGGMNTAVKDQLRNNNHPRYWESATDGKQVYESVVKQEGNFTPPNQNMFNYVKSAIQGGINILGNFSDMKKMKVTDKYKHAMMNCKAAQYGQGGADIATLASNLRE